MIMIMIYIWNVACLTVYCHGRDDDDEGDEAVASRRHRDFFPLSHCTLHITSQSRGGHIRHDDVLAASFDTRDGLGRTLSHI